MKHPKANIKSIQKNFVHSTGLPMEDIQEIIECFPASYGCTVHTQNRTFHMTLTHDGRVKKDSFYEEK